MGGLQPRGPQCRILARREEEGSFYAYAYPEPQDSDDWPVQPDAAHYDRALGGFVLPYAAVRAAADPDHMLTSFFQTTYDAATELAGWNRAALEAAPEPGSEPAPDTAARDLVALEARRDGPES